MSGREHISRDINPPLLCEKTIIMARHGIHHSDAEPIRGVMWYHKNVVVTDNIMIMSSISDCRAYPMSDNLMSYRFCIRSLPAIIPIRKSGMRIRGNM